MSHRKILLASIIATIILWTAFYFIGSSLRIFIVMCKSGAECVSRLDMFLQYSIIMLPFTFLVVLGISYLLSHLLNRGK